MNLWMAIFALLPAAGMQTTHRSASPNPAIAARTGGVRPAATMTRDSAIGRPNLQSGSFTLNVSPATISFAATNPDSVPVVAGSSAATVNWFYIDLNTGDWNLTVQAASPTFTNCPSVPVSAVTVTCASIQKLLGGSGNCSAPFPLSTTPQVLASGTQQILTFDYSVTINFTLADRWKYIAQTNPSCSLSLTYLANVP